MFLIDKTVEKPLTFFYIYLLKMYYTTMYYNYNSRQFGLLQITTTPYYNLRWLVYYNSRGLLLKFTKGTTIDDRTLGGGSGGGRGIMNHTYKTCKNLESLF